MKDRVTYTSQVLYVGPTGEGGSLGESTISGVVPTQLDHINYIEHSIEAENEHVYNYGSKEPIGEVIVDPPQVQMEFQYNLADAQNEKWLGFNISNLEKSFISGILNEENDEQNFYILTTLRGDAVTKASQLEFEQEDNNTVTSFGNCVVENYSLAASLSSPPTASIKVIGDNITYSNGVTGIKCPNDFKCEFTETVSLPAPREDDLEVDALRPAYLNLYFEESNSPQGGYVLPSKNTKDKTLSSCSLESFEINLELPRRIAKGLGNKHPVSKKIQYPAEVNFTCNASVKDIVSGSLLDVFCAEGNNLLIEMNNPYNNEDNIKVKLKDLHLDSQVSEHSLSTQEYIELNFSSPLGSPESSQVGIFMSGVADKTQETYYGTTPSQLLAGEKSTR